MSHMPNPSTNAATICLRGPGGRLHKIMKIVPYAKGGSAVMVPYHPAIEGQAFRFRPDYGPEFYSIKREDMVTYRASHRLKLSYHLDGFVQFSGERKGTVLSGRDPETGAPRGLGIFSMPLATPITSGPAFAIMLWGLEQFQALTAMPKTGIAVAFEPEDMYEENRETNGYAVEGFLFCPHFRPNIRVERGARSARRVTLPLWRQRRHGARIWEFTVLPGAEQSRILIGLLVTRMNVKSRAPSGYTLCGPSGFAADGDRWALTASYPSTADVREYRSLDLDAMC